MGLGAFEYVIVTLLPASAPHAAVLGGLVTYRVVYYLLPFSTAIVLLGWREWQRRELGPPAFSRPVLAALSSVAPITVALGVMVSGIVLMLSGSTPALPDRMPWLRELSSARWWKPPTFWRVSSGCCWWCWLGACTGG